MTEHDCVVVGAGPAGVSASVYMKRAGFDVVLFDSASTGGLVRNASAIENYPGVTPGITGPEMVNVLEAHLDSQDILPRLAHVSDILHEDGAWTIVSNTEEIRARAVIVATGTKPKKLDLEGIDDVPAERVFYEVADMKNVKDSTVAIIGAGDAAFDYALSLACAGNKVEILCRNEPRCLNLLRERVEKNTSIKVNIGFEAQAVAHEDDSIILDCGERRDFQADYLLIAIGRSQNIPNIVGLVDGGVFLAGDVTRNSFRQMGIAIGDGLLAAMMAEVYLKGGDSAWI